MPTLHRVAFDSGAFALLQLRDLVLPVVITAPLLVAAATLIAVRDPNNGDRWRAAPFRGRRGVVVSPLLMPAGVTQAEAVALVAPVLPAAVLAQLLP